MDEEDEESRWMMTMKEKMGSTIRKKLCDTMYKNKIV